MNELFKFASVRGRRKLHVRHLIYNYSIRYNAAIKITDNYFQVLHH